MGLRWRRTKARVVPAGEGFEPQPLSALLAGARQGGGREEGEEPEGEEECQEQATQAAMEEAARIVEAARRQAQEIARRAAEEAAEQARQEEIEAFRRAGQELVKRIEEQWRAFREELSAQIAQLAMEVAEKVIGEQVRQSPDVVVRMAQRVLEKLGEGGRVRLVVSVEDAGKLGERMKELLAALPPGSEIEIVADESFGPGDIVARGERAEVDARIGEQLKHIREQLDAA